MRGSADEAGSFGPPVNCGRGQATLCGVPEVVRVVLAQAGSAMSACWRRSPSPVGPPGACRRTRCHRMGAPTQASSCVGTLCVRGVEPATASQQELILSRNQSGAVIEPAADRLLVEHHDAPRDDGERDGIRVMSGAGG
jgi:hypothetical protein